MGHQTSKSQISFIHQHWQFRDSHGGVLRQKRKGRGARPLATKKPLHIVFKANRSLFSSGGGYRSPKGFRICERTLKRSLAQHFLRVVAGQIAQQFKDQCLLVTDTPKRERTSQRLWKHRPFTRIVHGWRAFQIVRDYVRLNEKEASGEISYQPQRLRGLSPPEKQRLWEEL